MVKAVVFDMDGLMFDTEAVASECWKALGKEIGLPVDDGFLSTLVGLDNRSIRTICDEHFGSDFDTDGFMDAVNRRCRAVLDRGMPEKPGLRALLAWLQDREIPMGIASSSVRETVKKNLSLCGLTDFFSAVICGDMVERGKPAPDIYTLAASTLGFPPEQCAALDDSPAGIRFAHDAGLRALMIPDRIAPTAESSALANAILSGLTDVPAWLEQH